jgi:MFS family permease
VALAILVLIYMLSAMDRQLVAILAEPIKAELQLSDTQLGFLTGTSFAMFYVVAGVPISWLADRANRVWIIGAASLVWSALTGLTGLVGSFWQLAILRMSVGIGEAGGTAPSLSLIADFYPPAKRGQANAIYIIGTPLGVIMGTLLAGWLGTEFGWRAAFYAAGAMGLLLTPLLLFIREPVRGRYDLASAQTAMRFGEVLRQFRRPDVLLVTVSVGINAFASLALLTWTPAFLMRSHHLTLGELGLWYSTGVGVSLAMGPWIAGYLVDRFGVRLPRIYAYLPATACALAAPLLAGGLLTTDWQLSLVLISAASFFAVMYFGASMALLHNLVPASGRTSATAILILVLNVTGLGLGPLVIGTASDALTPYYGGAALKAAMLGVVPVLMLAALSYAVLGGVLRTGLRLRPKTA